MLQDPFHRICQTMVVDLADHIEARLERVQAFSAFGHVPEQILSDLKARLRLVNEIAQVAASLARLGTGAVPPDDLAATWWILRDQYQRLSRNEQLDHSKLAALRHHLQDLVRCV